MTRDKVIELGFKELPHRTVTNTLVYDLGRNRFLSLGCLGTPNEMLFMYEVDIDNSQDITDMVAMSNYDYDGYLTEDKLSLLLTFFAENNKNKNK